ncbi:MAG: glycerate dehydrogenase [Betaproteobacteria bacterium RIFCSPLOWO2_12_FULL_68_19]|nr:MAG: glycerate dehydrogenase [Betaproteobacteria bacterium RIFCSPLOWO2_12_FULL_68_19]
MEEIVFLERDSLDAELRRPAFAHSWREHTGIPGPEETARLLEPATIAIVNKTPLRAATLARLPRLRMIAVAATGTDNVDIAACRGRGIVVSNVRGYAEHTVPEHAFCLILALRRSLLAYREDVKRGRWQQAERFCLSGHPIRDLHGATLGIFGEGSIGQGVARLGRAFGMEVLFADHAPPKAPDVKFTPADEVLARSDVISLHLPLTPQTRNLIGAPELARMKPGALLINTARGGLVDERALAHALRAGTLAGAGFDVLSVEPPRDGNPLLELDMPNFILTPHVAWSGKQAMQALADQLMDNVESFVRGAPRNVVS